jgi:hypothetical protein
MFKAGQGTAEQNVTQPDDLAELFNWGMSLLWRRYYEENLSKKGFNLRFKVSSDLKAKADGSLGRKEEEKVREAINLVRTLRLGAIGAELFSNKDFGVELVKLMDGKLKEMKADAEATKDSKKMERVEDFYKLKKVMGDELIANLGRSGMSAFFTKYSPSKLGAVADSIDNPYLTPEQQLENTKKILGPFMEGVRQDISKIPNDSFKLAQDVINDTFSARSPSVALMENTKLSLIDQLNKKMNYYNQIRASDEFSAREELQDIRSLQQRIKALEGTIAATPAWNLLEKYAAQTALQKALSKLESAMQASSY